MSRSGTPKKPGPSNADPRASLPGAEFERIVHWIQATLGEGDQVLLDQQIPDVDTGEPRQIDLAVWMCNGPIKALVIGEVRDRGRPAGSPWIEEVASKMRSVGARGAFVVSRLGFTRPAVLKARSLGIQAIDFREIDRSAWAGRFTLRGMGVRRVDIFVNVEFEDGRGELMLPHADVVSSMAALLTLPIRFPVGPPGDDPLCGPLREAMQVCASNCAEQLRDLEGPFLQRVTVRYEEELPFSSSTGERSLAALRFSFGFVPRLEALPFMLSRYVECGAADQVLAHVYESHVEFYGEKFRVRMLAETPDGVVRAGRALSFQVEACTDLGRRIFNEAAVSTSAEPSAAGSDEPVPVALNLRFRFHEHELAMAGLLGVRHG